MFDLYEYGQVKWSKGRFKEGYPLCPKCGGKPKLLDVYPMDYTETYKDYECTRCRFRFTVNWS